MHKVVLHGAFRDHLPSKTKKGFYLDFDNIREFLSGANQHLDLNGLMDTYGAEFRIGASVKTARRLTFEEVVHGRFKGISGEDEIKLHVIPCSDGDAITSAMIINALAQAAIAITVNLAFNALFPVDQPDNSTDKRKSMTYANGLNMQKEGARLPYVAGDNVLCPMNIIEGGVTTLQTGAAALRFTAGPGATSNQSSGGGGLGGPGRGTVLNLDQIAGLGNLYGDMLAKLVAQGVIEGDGGGSKGGKTMANTVFSSNRIRMLGAVGVGPMGGLVGATDVAKMQNVFINEVPLMSASGKPAFQGVDVETALGVAGQPEVRLTPNVESTINDPADLIKTDNVGTPVTYTRSTTVGVKTDLIRVRCNATLIATDKKSNQQPTSVQVAAKTWRQGQPQIHYGTWTINAKTSEPCQFDLPITAPPVAPGGSDTDRWFFSIYRITADSGDDKLQNGTSIQGWTEVQYKRLTYDGSTGCPPTASLAVAIDNAQFGDTSIPEIAARWQGYKCRVHTNYNPVTKVHTGTSTGALKNVVTSNPAYHWWSLATLVKGGAGIPDSYFDKYNIKAAAEFCDETVKGRPRFTLNKSFTDAATTLDLFRDLAQTFRCYMAFDGRQFRLIPDKPGQAVSHYINNEGVQDGFFNLDSTPIQDRINEVIVEWDNPADFDQTAVVKYRDEAAIAICKALDQPEGGVVSKRVYKIGCNNEAEALDWARYLVYCAQNEFESVTFTTLLGATGYEPGQLIGVTDYELTREFKQGRIAEVLTANTLRMDAPVTLAANTAYKLFAQGPTGLIIKNITQVTSAYNGTDITVSGHGLVEGSMARPVKNSGVQPITYRIVSIQENSPGVYTITANLHSEAKYAFVDGTAPAVTPPWTSQSQEPLPPPADIRIRANSPYSLVTGSKHELHVSWSVVNGARSYMLEGRRPNGSMETLQHSGATSFTLRNCEPGPYLFTVKAVNIAGASGQPQVETYHFGYEDDPPVLAPAPLLDRIF